MTIVEKYTFDMGEPFHCDDLSEVDAVVRAIVRALDIRADIWAPFPREDLCRDEHVRRLSLVLQRHGLNLPAQPAPLAVPLDGRMKRDRLCASSRFTPWTTLTTR